jgi:formyltetrahydrofolate hydrolase
MRPEKIWRPIVTVEIDKHYTHEATLGVDGQSVNRKDCFRLYVPSSHFWLRLSPCVSIIRSGMLTLYHLYSENVPLSSKVDIHIWHSPQTKKKKSRVLVARATHCLGELMKKTEADAEHSMCYS